MQANQPIEINIDEFSHLASIYLLGVASTCHVTPEVALTAILEAVSRSVMPSFVPAPRRWRLTKEGIKQWLKVERKDRQWLADQCCVGKRAVDKWLSTAREIPPAKLRLIEQLMVSGGDRRSAREEVCHA